MAASQAAALTDAQLVQGVLAGEEDRFDELYRRHERGLIYVAWRITGNARAAREVVLATMEAAREHLGEYNPSKASIKTWLHRSCRNRAFNFKRDAGRRAHRTCSLEEVEETRLPSSPGPAQDHARRVRCARVREAVRRLPAAQREVVELVWYEGLSRREAAARLGRPLGGIRHALVRAHARLRLELADLLTGERG